MKRERLGLGAVVDERLRELRQLFSAMRRGGGQATGLSGDGHTWEMNCVSDRWTVNWPIGLSGHMKDWATKCWMRKVQK